MKLHAFKTRKERAAFIQKQLHIQAETIEAAFKDDESKVHCENLIGAVTIPMGVAGPLTVHGETAKGDFYIPLATTEGALVASVSRGCKAITASGGASVFAYKVGATRGPVFYTPTLKEQRALYKWVKLHEDDLKTAAESTSNHVTYKKVMIRALRNYTYMRFYFDTDDAMGMNMVTIASQKMAELIEKETGAVCMAVAGNFDIDKKPSWLNFIDNRGFKAWAEVILKKDLVEDVLKVSPKKIHDLWLAKCMFGSAMSGSMGFNAHFANIIAALFAATGQDLAHVVEGSMGITSALLQDDGSLYFSVYVPALMLGTVGGGTKLKTQSEALNILGVKHSLEFAEVTAAAVLAGELSLLASIAEGSLVRAHKSLGRSQ